MTKTKKAGLFLVNLILIAFFSSVAALYYQAWPWKITYINDELKQINHFIATNNLWHHIMFWTALVLLVLSILMIFTYLFVPSKLSSYSFKNGKDTLTLMPKAIERFVKTSVDNAEFMDNPKVSVDVKKRKINVKVRGKLRSSADVTTKEQAWSEQLKHDLDSMLGLKQKTKVNVKLVDLKEEAGKQPEKHHAKKSRVE